MKRYLPTRERLRQKSTLRFLGDMLLEPNLWHFNRHSLSYAFLVGGFCCFLPVPFFQMIPCVLLCIWLRCNVPVAIVLIWINNPVTLGPMMYFACLTGAWLLGFELQVAEPSFGWFMSQLTVLWLPLLLGSLVCGLITGVTGFLIVRIYYRWRIARYKLRKRRDQGSSGYS